MVEPGSFYFPTSVDDAVEYAEFLDESRFATLWMADSQQLYADAYVSLAACALATEDIALRTGVTNPVSRHRSVTANAIATVNQLSDDRAALGIGAGDSGVYSIGKTPARVDELRDAVVDIRSLLAGEPVEFDGESFELEQQYGSVDVYVAAEGPKTLQMAGEIADGVVFGGGVDPDVVEELGLANVREGAERAGRTLDDVELVTLTPACVAETRADAARALMHMLEPIAYHNFSVSMDDAPDDLHDELRNLVEAHDMREHGDQEARKPEELPERVQKYLADRWAVAGPPSYCRDRLRALDEVGVDHAMLTFPTGPTLEYAREYDREVLEPMGDE